MAGTARRVHVLLCGHEESDKGYLTLMKDCGKTVSVPYHAYLIEDSEYNILVDTGASIRWRELHPETLVKTSPVFIENNERIDHVIESIGFSNNDISYVINTHLHYDHCGNNEMFPQARFLVNASELSHAMAPGWWEAFSYVRAVFDKSNLKYDLLTGDFEVLPGISIIQTPGHTEGHQSIVVQLEATGTLVLAGDAIYIRENLEGPALPGIYVNAEQYALSMAKLKRIIELRKGTLLLSHSREYFTTSGWRILEKPVQVFQ